MKQRRASGTRNALRCPKLFMKNIKKYNKFENKNLKFKQQI